MSRMKGSSFFCEDLRAEMSGQPMFIGVLSPVVEFVNPNEIMRKLFFVSFFYPEEEHSGIDLKLTISVTHSDSDETTIRGPLIRSLADEISEGENEDIVIASLPLDDIDLRAGSVVKARLEFGDEVEEYSLRAKVASEGDNS